jgi:cytokinesis protein
LENRTAAEEKLALERRRQAAEDAKANRKKAENNALAQEAEETAALDNLLEKLRNGDNVGRRARRARPSAVSTKEVMAPPPPPADKDVAPTPVSAFGGTTADIARGMLEQLKTNGFVSESFTPISPTMPPVPRRRRLRGGSLAAVLAAELEAAGDSPPTGSPGIDNGSSLPAGPGTHNDYGSDTGRED